MMRVQRCAGALERYGEVEEESGEERGAERREAGQKSLNLVLFFFYK